MSSSCYSRLWYVGLRAAGALGRIVRQGRRLGCLLLVVAAIAELAVAADSQGAAAGPRPRTFANPINIEYRFQTRQPSRREAADPVIVLFEDEYYLFASATGGYWHSSDMIDWTLVTPGDRAFEAYAPAAMVYDGAIYYYAEGASLLRTKDPKSGKWESLGRPFSGGDPALFVDDDGRVFLYYGLAYNGAISGRELDPKNGFRPLGQPFVCFRANSAEHGWERRGNDNLGVMSRGRLEDGPWFEGSWMSKHAGTYYLQYAAPGTEFGTYADGVYTAKSPTGPYTYAPYSPFSFKPTGFMPGAGHGATFADKQGRYWHVTTMVIAMKHEWERRLGIFPVEFDADGQMHANTLFGDYPMLAPAERKDDATLSPGWMLVSFAKRAEASSSIEGFEPGKAFDEDVHTYWSAQSDKPGEWLSVDLGKRCRIDAVQVNFAEHESTAVGRSPELYHQYRLEWSNDGAAWTMLADRSENRKDVPHDYLPLAEPVTAQYVRITNVRAAGGGPLSIRDLRLFGSGGGNPPAKAPSFEVERDANDPRNGVVRWEPVDDADGYVVRYGITEKKLHQNREIRGPKEIELHDLNVGVDYYFTVDALNDSGRTLGAPQLAR